jgi:hypothetical protein
MRVKIIILAILLGILVTLTGCPILENGRLRDADAAGPPYILTCNPPPAGSTLPTFYYLAITGLPSGTAGTYTPALPDWFTQTGGVAIAPDPTGATGFSYTLPVSMSPPVSGTAWSCDGVGCMSAPFGPPSAAMNVTVK